MGHPKKFADPFETMIALDVTPTISVAPRGDTTSVGFQRLEVDYKFPYTVYGFERQLSVEFLPNDQRPEPSLFYLLPYGNTGLALEGHLSIPVSGLATGSVVVRSVACSARNALQHAPLAEQACEECRAGQPPTCKTCVGHPVRTSSGNMRYVESEPLPPLGGLPLRRTYDSVKNKVGSFGRGWRSIFDAVVTASSTPALDGGIYATVTTEDGIEYVFRSTGTGYKQVVPADPGRATQLTSTAQGFVHTEQDGQVIRTFNTTGFLSRRTEVRTRQGIEIEYDMAGVPVRVRDLRGSAAWVVTADSTRRITNLTVEGRPDIVWTYVYSGDRLVSVTSPVGPWRTYQYQSSWPTAAISVIRDGQGRLIEQHSYDNNNRATSSYGIGADDIQTIAYNLPEQPGTVGLPGGGMIQRTIITKRSGATETHLLQSFGGAWRPIQITGGCSSCGADDATFIYDVHGNVIRSQNAIGYVTENSFSADGVKLTATVTALRPATCDPATDSARCRMGANELASALLVETEASEHLAYAYGDTNWQERPTEIVTDSVVVDDGNRVESFVYDAVTGATMQRTASGWTGVTPRQESQTTTSTLYDGAEGAAFAPGGSFDPAWTTLPQPQSEVKQTDGPRADVADQNRFVYYPVNDAVPATLRGRLAAVRNAAGHTTRYEAYDVFGNATRVVDPNGLVTESTYDAMGRLLTSVMRGIPGCDT